MGVLLIIIPYTLKNTDNIRQFIYKRLLEETLTEYTDSDLDPALIRNMAI